MARVSSMGVRKTALSVTTEHTLTRDNITRYRNTYLWIVAVFDQAMPEAIFEIPPSRLEPYFGRWEEVLVKQEMLHQTGGAPTHLNNPKIPICFVRDHGLQVWPPRDVELPPAVQEGLET